MRIIITATTFLVVTLLGTGLAEGQESVPTGLGYVATLLVAVLAAGLVHRLFPGRHHGSTEGDCVRCRGEGYAFYGTGRATYRRRCRTCRGSGAARDARQVSRARRRGGVIVAADEPAPARREVIAG
jgi:hypothetical protein